MSKPFIPTASSGASWHDFVKAWLNRRQVSKDMQNIVKERPWSEAFQDSAVDFVDQLIDENKALFEALARL